MSLTIAASLDSISTKASSSLIFTFCVFLSLSLCPLLVVWTAGQMMVNTWLWGCSMESSAYGTKMARKKWRSSGLGAPYPRYGPSAGTLQGALTAILILEQFLSLPVRSLHAFKGSQPTWLIGFGTCSIWMEFFKSPSCVLEWIPEI